MTDKQFLQWIHDRLVNQHGESSGCDYMRNLRGIIKEMPEEEQERCVCGVVGDPSTPCTNCKEGSSERLPNGHPYKTRQPKAMELLYTDYNSRYAWEGAVRDRINKLIEAYNSGERQ